MSLNPAPPQLHNGSLFLPSFFLVNLSKGYNFNGFFKEPYQLSLILSFFFFFLFCSALIAALISFFCPFPVPWKDCCCMLNCSVMSNSFNPMDYSLPGSSVGGVGFSRQEYCSGFPFPPPGDLSHPLEPTLHADSLSAEPSGKPMERLNTSKSQTKL